MGVGVFCSASSTVQIAVTSSTVGASSTLTAIEKEYVGQLLSIGVDVHSILAAKMPTPMYCSSTNIYNVKKPDGSNFYSGTFLDQAKGYYKDAGLDFDALLISTLKSNGINVDTTTAAVTVSPLANPTSEATKVDAALKTGGAAIQSSLLTILNGLNLGTNHDAIYSFFSKQTNNPAIQQAINKLGYPVPTTTDQNGIHEMLQLYWGAYYSNLFPIPAAVAGSCGQVAQSLTQLLQEKVNLSQAATQQAVESTFLTDSQMDTQMKLQAVQDLISKFNGLYAQLSCTSSQSGKGNAVIGWAIIGVVVVLGIVIVKKIFHKNSSDA